MGAEPNKIRVSGENSFLRLASPKMPIRQPR